MQKKLLPLLKSYGFHFERRRADRGGSFDLRSVSALRVHDHTQHLRRLLRLDHAVDRLCLGLGWL